MGYFEEDFGEYEEECYQMENTEVKKQGETLFARFDTEAFAREIVAAVYNRLKEELYQDILRKAKEEIFDSMKGQIMLSTHEIVKDMVLEFLEKEKVTIGGTAWDDDERKELTLTQYSKQCIKECIEKGKFRVFKGIEESRYSKGKYNLKSEEYSFGEYIAQELGIGGQIKTYLDSEIVKIRNQVNAQIKDAFDESTKTLLSNAVLQVLMSNETYKKIQTSISHIADKSEEK